MHTHIGSKKIAIAKCIYRFNSISRSIHRLLRLYTLILRSSSRSSSVCAVWIFCSVFSHSNFIFMLLSLLMEFRFGTVHFKLHTVFGTSDNKSGKSLNHSMHMHILICADCVIFIVKLRFYWRELFCHRRHSR